MVALFADMADWDAKLAAAKAAARWGVSVEDRKYGLPRIEDLRNTRAGVRFLSVEPLLEDLGKVNLRGVDWMIVGGESGAGARPMKKEWVLDLRDQCETKGIPFFFKQWGGVRKKAAGRRLAGRTYDEFPRRVTNPVMPATDCVKKAEEITAQLGAAEIFPLSLLKANRNEEVFC